MQQLSGWIENLVSSIRGIDDVDAPFMEQIKHQAEIAMDEADVIVFVVSGKEGITDADEYVTRILYKTHKPVILAVNKLDNPEMRNDIYDFYALGLGEPLPVSSVHGSELGMFSMPSSKIFRMTQKKKIQISSSLAWLVVQMLGNQAWSMQSLRRPRDC